MGKQFRIVAKGAKDGQVKTRYVDGLKENCPADIVENTDEYMRCILPEMVEHAARDGLFEWWQIWEYQTLIAASENAPQIGGEGMSDIGNNPLDSIELTAARRKVRELEDRLTATQAVNNALRDRLAESEDRLDSARAVLSDTADRLHEEIANAEQAEERLASVEAYSANVIEANGELMQRVMVLEGSLVLCGRHFTALDQPHWTEEVDRVLWGEEEKA